MGANPMQKMKRNSILTGLIIGLVVGLIMCAGMYLLMGGSQGGSGKEQQVTICVLNNSIKSGTAITQADVTMKTIGVSSAPSDATTEVLGSVAKIDLTAGTILSKSLITTEDSKLTKDLRTQEYNMLSLPTQLTTGDFVDIRLQLPSGADYIVISKKRVKNANATTIWLDMNEEEILTMSNAIVEYYIMAGSKLYATKYTSPASQEAATPTYTPNADVVALMGGGDPNITSQIVDGQGRFSTALKNIRNNSINKEINKYSEDALKNIEEGIQEEIKTLKESRESYFGALNSASTTK